MSPITNNYNFNTIETLVDEYLLNDVTQDSILTATANNDIMSPNMRRAEPSFEDAMHIERLVTCTDCPMKYCVDCNNFKCPSCKGETFYTSHNGKPLSKEDIMFADDKRLQPNRLLTDADLFINRRIEDQPLVMDQQWMFTATTRPEVQPLSQESLGIARQTARLGADAPGSVLRGPSIGNDLSF